MTLHPLAVIVEELDRFGIPHMLAGAFASTYHGDPRTTNDIDVVIDPSRDALDALVRGLDPARSAFERREPAEIASVSLFVATAEDAIVAVSGGRIDRGYLDR